MWHFRFFFAYLLVKNCSILLHFDFVAKFYNSNNCSRLIHASFIVTVASFGLCCVYVFALIDDADSRIFHLSVIFDYCIAKLQTLLRLYSCLMFCVILIDCLKHSLQSECIYSGSLNLQAKHLTMYPRIDRFQSTMERLWTETNKISATTKLFSSHQTHPHTHKCASIIQTHSIWVHSVGCEMMENVKADGVIGSKVFAR